MATLTGRPRSSSRWVLIICAVFVAVLVLGLALFVVLDPGLRDAVYIAWTAATGHGTFAPQ